MTFEFATAGRVLFGPGVLGRAAAELHALGRRFLVVCGRSVERVRPLILAMESAGVEARMFSVRGEPTVEDADRGRGVGREQGVDGVVGFGGGSAIDAGKAIAALIPNRGEVRDYLETIGRGQPLEKPPVPFVAIPTTAGTGTEVTRNAVLLSPEHRVKVSLRSPWMLARLAVIDPELTYGLPPGLTAATGLDALTQLIEPFVSCRANPMTDALCREGMRRVAGSLSRAYAMAWRIEAGAGEPSWTTEEKSAREDLAVASWFSGMALANAGLGAVHGFAGPLGGMFPAPHGAVCAALLPTVTRANLAALRARVPASEALARYDEVARTLTGDTSATADEGVRWLEELIRALGVRPLRDYGIRREHLPELVEKASRASSMKGNPIPLSAGELTAALERAL